MADLHYLFNSMNGGEMSPQMDLRVDNEKYNSGARVLENFIVKPYGGIYKRPGTQFVGNTLNNQIARIEGFSRNQESSYILEFTPGYLRVITVFNTAEAEKGLWTDKNADGTTNYFQSFLLFTNNSQSLSGWKAGDYYNTAFGPVGTYYQNQLFTANVTITATGATDQPLSAANWTDYWTPYYYKPNDIIYLNGYNGVGGVESRGFKCIKTTNFAPSALFVAYTDPSISVNTIDSEMAKLSANWSPLPYYNQIVFETPYTIEDIFDLQIESINDVIFITHKKYRPRKLSRLYADYWTFEDVVFDFAPALDVDITPNVVQIQYDSAEWEPNTSYLIGDRVAITTATYSTMSAISAVGLFTCNTAHTSTSASNAATGKPGSTSGKWTDYWNRGTNFSKYTPWGANVSYKVGNTVWYGKNLYTCKANHISDGVTFGSTVKGAQKTFGKTTPEAGKAWTVFWTRTGAGTDLTDLRYKLVSQEPIFNSASVGETWQIRVPVANYFRRLQLGGTGATQTLEATDEIFFQGQLLVSSRWDLGYAPVGTYYLEESLDGVTWTVIQLFIVESTKDNNISFTYEAPTKGAWYRLSGQRNGDAVAASNARSLLIEPANAILTVPFLISQYVDANTVKGYPTFNNNQIMPEEVVGISTSYYKKPAFSASTGYPASVALHESRLWFGGIETQPTRVWGSQKDDFYNFLLGTNATDALDLTLQARNTNRIRWMKSFNKQLVVATDGEVYTIDAGDGDASISPTTIRGRVRLYNGGCNIPGTVTTDSLLYFQNGNRRLREFAYNFQTDSFVAPDMTVLADHVNGSGFTQSALMRNPEPVLWSVNQAGELLGFSYDRAQNITAWHRHTTAGPRLSGFQGGFGGDKFISVTSIISPVYENIAYPDEIWFVVKRGNYYNIERFDQFVMDYIYGGKIGRGRSTFLTQELEAYGSVFGGWKEDIYAASRYGYLDSYAQTTTTTIAYSGAGVPVYNHYYWQADTTSTLPLPVSTAGRMNNSLQNRNVFAVYTTGKSLCAGPITFPRNVSGYPSGFSTRNITVPYDSTIGLSGPPGDTFTTQMVIGIPVYSVYIPTRFDIKLDNGTSMGRKHRINRVEFKPWRTVGGRYSNLDSFRSTLSGGRALELLPTFDTPTNPISYQDFNFNITPDVQNFDSTVVAVLSGRPWLQTYSGSTADTTINGNWTENPLFAVVHYDAAPFNLLGMVWKMEVQGN